MESSGELDLLGWAQEKIWFLKEKLKKQDRLYEGKKKLKKKLYMQEEK